MTETALSHVRLSGRLPKGEANGLDSLAPDLVATPEKVRYAVVAYDVEKITSVVESHDRFPSVRIIRVEGITSAEDATTVQEILQTAFRERTGLDELPIDDDEPEAEPPPADGDDNVTPIGGKK